MTILIGSHSLEFGLGSIFLFLPIMTVLRLVHQSVVSQSLPEPPTL